MSYLEGRKNVFSLISACIIKNIKNNYAINNKLEKDLKNNLKQDTQSNPSIFLSTPKNLVSTSLLTVNCGNSPSNSRCLECMKQYKITDAMLTGDNYMKNIDIINNVRNNQCFGLCSCEFSNINLTSNLMFTTGSSINGEDLDTASISKDVTDSMASYNKSESSGKEYNWLYSVLGGAAGAIVGPEGAVAGAAIGAGIAALDPTYTKQIEENVKSAVSNMSMLYANTINQLISSSREITVKGVGIKVHNISISSVENIVMVATQSNCGQDNTCVSTNIDNITNSLMGGLQDFITTSFESQFTYAFEQNKTLIIYAGVFIVGTLLIYFYLLFKRASHAS